MKRLVPLSVSIVGISCFLAFYQPKYIRFKIAKTGAIRHHHRVGRKSRPCARDRA